MPSGGGGDIPPVELPPAMQECSSRVAVPSGPQQRKTESARPLLSSFSGINVDESFGDDERLLNDFVKRHPMLRCAFEPLAHLWSSLHFHWKKVLVCRAPTRSMEATSVKTLQLVSGMLDTSRVKVPEVPTVPKSYDDTMLSPPNKTVGERECICGDACLCMFMANIRYGPENDKGFICKEFLLPEQKRAFLKGEGLPKQRKCLVCTRYYLNYVYLLARSDRKFKMDAAIRLQPFQNPPTSCAFTSGSQEIPDHCSRVGSSDGYLQTAMLFVDEGFAQTRVQRESGMSLLSFKPVVRFCSSHYRFCKDTDGKKSIVQVGIGVDDHLNGLGFQ